MTSTILATPTQEELVRIWSSTHPSWGAALPLQGYLDREASQVDIPLAENGGLARWILTTPDGKENDRPILSSCETLRKRALVRDAGSETGAVREVITHGVGSVYTDFEHRRKGHAGVMMAKLGEAIGKRPEQPLFSVLYSDIGKVFYAKQGWKAFESTHLEFPASTTASSSPSQGTIRSIVPEDLPPVAAADEALIRKTLESAPVSSKSRVAVLPDLDQLRWHAEREALQCKLLFSKTPSTHGVLYTPSDSSSSRVWAVWKRNHSGPVAEPDKNTLFILRFVIEDEENITDEQLKEAIEAIISAARKEAAEWACGKVEMWNPSSRVQKLAEESTKLEASYVNREEDSITSLRWYGSGSADEVEWIVNEKFAWC